ncbi:general odorant-binding protein 83a-like [Onthophagus taurus]|uniref:general odorant-binding protein 83a-like n=1 Tax=Onthophagus taurus TaxID=166361 RepID=UPI000C207404|nr:uncharacterized protein LOC111415593 [Onthophagus taurus]
MCKKFLTFLALIVSTYATIPDYVPTELHDWMISMRNKCIQEAQITEADVDTYVISNNAQPMMCYMKCLMREARWMTPDHQVNYEVIGTMEFGDMKDIVMAALEKCKTFTDGKEPCETAYNFNVCLQQADPVHYFLP